MITLEGRTALVVGAGGPIGAAVAMALGDAGAAVAVMDRDAERLGAVAGRLAEAGHRHAAFGGDCTDADTMAEVLGEAEATLAPVDALVCVVGGVEAEEFGPLLADGVRTYDAVLDRNLRSAVVAHQVVAASMAARGRGGAIVSVSAATAFAAAPFHALYGAAKAALVALARTEAVEWGHLGIRVNTVAPGAVATRPAPDPEEMRRAERAAIPLGRRVVPADVAGAVLFLVSDLAAAVTGQTLVVDGGALAKPAFLDADNVPLFVTDRALRDRMRDGIIRSDRATKQQGDQATE